MYQTHMRIRATLLAVAVSGALTAPALAREDFKEFSVQEATESSLGKERLFDVPFYMKGQEHPPVDRVIGVYTANKRTSGVFKSDAEACKVAFLSALISLQQRVNKEGGDAVIDIRSITRHNDLESPTEYRCVAGSVIVNVALEGRVVKLK